MAICFRWTINIIHISNIIFFVLLNIYIKSVYKPRKFFIIKLVSMKFKRFFSIAKPIRNPSFSILSPSHLAYFRSILKENEIITDENDLKKYNIDWMDKYHGNSPLVLQPHTVAQISSILSFCNKEKLAIVPQGGNTGLVGGSTAVHDELVLSLRNLNKIKNFDINTDVLSCGAGCILQDLNTFLRDYGYEVPLDLGARGSCFIGGNFATNAGGKYFIRHGSLRGHLLGLEVVLANGNILNMSSDLRKDNTGYDLKNLFVGSEGLLGVITACDFVCKKKPKHQKLLIFTCENFEKVLAIHQSAKNMLSLHLSAFEYMDPLAYQVVIDKIPNIQNPFPNKPSSHYLAFLEIVSAQDIDPIIESFYNALEPQKAFVEAIISDSETQFEELWKIRESVAESCNKIGLVYKYDLSLKINSFDDLTKLVREKTKGLAFTVGYGHIGDGNIHINVAVHEKKNNEKVEAILEPFIFQWLRDKKGSISAEHGLGLMKGKYLDYAKGKEVIEKMKEIKKIFDPNGILNPYKVLPL